MLIVDLIWLQLDYRGIKYAETTQKAVDILISELISLNTWAARWQSIVPIQMNWGSFKSETKFCDNTRVRPYPSLNVDCYVTNVDFIKLIIILATQPSIYTNSPNKPFLPSQLRQIQTVIFLLLRMAC